ncbi:CRISPR-associated helicase Cas3' [Paenibacillus xylaniclasticus]|uniref:CRISPR-associated helicase Cas3' n=1 Tax=Paenibacillus xylaniclasticus TaxID=588083 RepID=UPI000FDBCEAD|nr:CRISPR-associated helicase Cas3' [Paenibacillus xylaniclasticus]
MNYIAHIRESDHKEQSVKEHLIEVQALAESYGAKIGVKYLAGLAGLLHDMGKFTNEFQEYIREAVNNPTSPPRRGSVDHSTAGGKLLYDLFHTGPPSKLYGITAEVVGNAILSHHSYLQDFLSPDSESPYLKRVTNEQLPGYHQARSRFFEHVMNEQDFKEYVSRATLEMDQYLNASSERDEVKLMFLTKYLFSVLIDADRTNTRQFEQNEPVESERNYGELFEIYYERLLNKVKSYPQEEANKPINVLRRQMSDQCDEFAGKPSGIYTLSIPTGGGKTLASLRYGLKHALEKSKKRIIYVVPYTTIIEQNAEEVRKILLDHEHILEHHSNVINDDQDDEENIDGMMDRRMNLKLKLAKDNWDSPIIFTTMVQFLNVFYARGSRNIRRLHNLSESVIIFDEVQKVPISCVSLFNLALNFLKNYCKSSLILCTATQPALESVDYKLHKAADAEIIEDLDDVIDAFKRVEIIDRASEETFDTNELAEFVMDKLDEVRSVLVILNTKSVVKSLYHQLRDCQVPLYHLSTSMCAAHRSRILEKIRSHLDREERIVCISTPLIEAGVDVSFDCVIRSLAGLDSIAQAAGRCNRHGKYDTQQVYVIDHSEENLKHLKEIQVGKKLSKQILRDIKRNATLHGGNILSVSAMDLYFLRLYKEFKTSLNHFVDKYEIEMTNLLIARRNQNVYHESYRRRYQKHAPLFLLNSYRTAAEHFEVIDSVTTAVIAPYDDKGKEMIAQLNGGEKIDDLTRLLRQAQQYTINLFRYEREQLERSGGLVNLLNGKILALTESAYSDEYGLNLQNDSRFDLSIY